MENLLNSALPFWHTLTQTQKAHLISRSQEVTLKKGEQVSGRTGNCTGLYIIESGQLRAYINSENGREITLYRLFSRDVCLMSASCMMKGLSYSINIEAMQETKAILIPPLVYKEICDNVIEASTFTNTLMAQLLQDILWLVEQALFTSMDKRLASFLLEQSTIDGKSHLTITHDEIARHLGSAREVITRMLKYFATEGYVELFRGGIEIIDEKSLRKLSD